MNKIDLKYKVVVMFRVERANSEPKFSVYGSTEGQRGGWKNANAEVRNENNENNKMTKIIKYK